MVRDEGVACSQKKPLVSVLVRSMDRPQLCQALDSLALQTYPNLEVLVINALGREHGCLGDKCGCHRLRLVSTGVPLRRGAAANVGLENAAGDYLLFLDDDDWLAPNHISSLVAALSMNGACKVAYAGVEVRSEEGGALDVEPFNASYDAGRLRYWNYIPIHAILFSRTLVDQGLRFDEAFDAYEDWDFLLQLSQVTHFVHVNMISAYYRAGGTSGVGVNADPTLERYYRERIFEKWKNRWTGAQIDEMVRAAGDIGRAGLEERDRMIESLNRRVNDMIHSRSWRFSAPVRWSGRCARRGRQVLNRVLRRVVGSVLRYSPWLELKPIVTQGFCGEPISEPTDNGEMPLISVIIPVYNACRSSRRFLLRAMESVACQTYPNVELVVVDDGSTDETPQVCKDFLARRPCLRAQYLTKENGGQSSARNLGVTYCHGEYVAFLDQDDEWYVDKLERVVPWLRNKDIDVLYTDGDFIDADDKVMFRGIHQIQHRGWPHPKRTIEDVLFKDIFVMPGLVTIKREVFEQVGGFDENLSGYEDDDLFLRLFETFRVFYLPIPTLRWRIYGDSYSSSHRMLTSRTYYWKKLLDNYTEGGTNRFRSHMISLRFFGAFMSQAVQQYRAQNPLCWDSLDGAMEILPHLPRVPRFLFSLLFLFPDRFVLCLLQWSWRLVLDG